MSIRGKQEAIDIKLRPERVNFVLGTEIESRSNARHPDSPWLYCVRCV